MARRGGVFHKLPARREKERRTAADERQTSASLRKQCGLRMRWGSRRAADWPACWNVREEISPTDFLTSSLVKKAHQRLFFLRTLKKNQLSADILGNFYRCAIESILTNCISAWYGNCTVTDRKALQRVVKTAQRIIGTPIPAIEDVHKKRCLRRARNILKDSSHPANKLFQLLPSRRRYRSLRTKTSRFRNSFFPTAVTLLNSVPR
ncbi:uncharacterized protein LOC125745137 [Brienomyrus brachyistius]|uniref:uncharacterized protein LOC125745137 n=1 Tax=Brienomyrus brachyistius TaxID=42636 RepID=UPI0020B1C8B8|nr:uncharacterized protein LOC125745137 [Brienomyrus brachyistius]